MANSWQELVEMTQGSSPLVVERVRVVNKGIAIEGSFPLPALASLAAEDQAFVCAFVRCHGSIKEMERFLGVSYPTIKSRLVSIGEQLAIAETAAFLSSRGVIGRPENIAESNLYEAAVRHVVTTGHASTSSIQRKLKIGYSRAVPLIELMEEQGIIGPAQDAKPRDVLISPDDLDAMFARGDSIDE